MVLGVERILREAMWNNGRHTATEEEEIILRKAKSHAPGGVCRYLCVQTYVRRHARKSADHAARFWGQVRRLEGRENVLTMQVGNFR